MKMQPQVFRVFQHCFLKHLCGDECWPDSSNMDYYNFVCTSVQHIAQLDLQSVLQKVIHSTVLQLCMQIMSTQTHVYID